MPKDPKQRSKRRKTAGSVDASYGLEVNVAHAQHTKTLPGRKTDVQECQWLQKLHTFGLLNKAFRPAEERDPEKLARHKHARIRASHQEIARSLEGTWREELLFVVGQSLELYDTYQEKIQLCDQRIDEHLHKMEAKVDPTSDPIPEPTRRGKGSRPRQPHFDLRGHLYRITGVDLTQIDSIDVRIAQTVISEVGLDMSRWKTEKGMETEKAFLDALKQVNRWKITGQQLELFDAGGKLLATFEAHHLK